MKEKNWLEYKDLVNSLVDFYDIENNVEIDVNFNKVVECLNKSMVESLLKTKLGRK